MVTRFFLLLRVCNDYDSMYVIDFGVSITTVTTIYKSFVDRHFTLILLFLTFYNLKLLL